LRFDSADLAGFLKYDGPGKYREYQKDAEDNSRHPARLLNQRLEPAGHNEQCQT
jgi:hypothetical protein